MCLSLSGGVFGQDGRAPAGGQRFTICIDINFWAPYTFVKDNKARGLHVELAQKAFADFGHQIDIVPRPWNRCMVGGRDGYYDAVLSASYRDNRTLDFAYPDGAAGAERSPLRVTQAEYVVVVRTEDHFEWQGEDASLPKPVGLPLGYAQVAVLRDKGIPVSTAIRYLDLFRMLARGRVNSLLVVRPAAEFYLENEQFERPLSIIDRPHRSTSYYMLVARKGRIPMPLANDLWQKIALLRDDEAFMAAAQKKVMAELETCFSAPARCN